MSCCYDSSTTIKTAPVLCLVLALGASPLDSLSSSTRFCCFTSSALTFAHFISPSRTLCRMLFGLEISLIYVRIARTLSCISLQFSTFDKGIDPIGTVLSAILLLSELLRSAPRMLLPSLALLSLELPTPSRPLASMYPACTVYSSRSTECTAVGAV